MDEQDGLSCSLASRECVPCRGDLPPLTGAPLRELAGELGSDWKVVDGHHLEKEFAFEDFRQALGFVNKVGALAESVGHHPDLFLSYGKCIITVWTHKIDGLAEADFVFAAKVDALT